MRRAFTLIEVLIVVAIISLLAAILFPVFAGARAMGRRAACTSQLRQIGLGLQIYRQDWNELPQLLSHVHPQYVPDARVFLCPDDAQKGQYAGNVQLEGNVYLPSGVSYRYFPQWITAQGLGWYAPAPNFGAGKWEDLTPVSACEWHWATGTFDPNLPANNPDSHGWQIVLTLGGSVRKLRVEEASSEFSPDKYH